MGSRLEGKVAIVTGAGGGIGRFTEEEWDLTVGVNLKGYFAIIKHAVPHLVEQETSVIVNTSSGSGFGTMAPRGGAPAPETSPKALAPRKIAPLVVWPCTDAGHHLTEGLVNDYALDDRPDIQEFVL